ncbi:uncharacterized protein LOC124160108 isoform X1 [Ischnura elegans]|uniref:uncharacterized protein LOC124160108 isoform X1 n=1 Tax=Ischnura elegans TaxID=197161 RepID=UPI001ED8B22C|nr:uncharacterized protein LOC124160108 isoform X1 [Ischnura elegans]
MAFDVENSCPCFWDSLLCLSRVWGLLTAAEKLPEAAKAVLKKTIPRIQKAAKAPDNPSTSSSASSPAAIPTPPAADITSQPASSSAPPEAASTQPSAAKQQDNAPALNTDRILDRVRPGDSVGHVAASSCLPKCRRAQRLPNGGEADEGDPAGVALRGGGLVSVVLKWCEGPSRKGVLYAVLGAVVLLWPHQHLWLSPVAGSMLLLLAALNLLLTLKTRGEEALGDSLLPPDDSGAFDRLDDVSDESSADATPPWKGASSLVGPAQQRLHGAECSGPGLKGPQLL